MFDTSVLHDSLAVNCFSKEAFVSTFDALLHACYSQRVALSSLRVHHGFMMHIRPCSLYIAHSCIFPNMQWKDEVQLIVRQLVTVTTFDWMEVM